MSTIQCLKCDKETDHAVLHSVSRQHEEGSASPEEIAMAQEDPNFDDSKVFFRGWTSRHELIQCEQCETVSYREVTSENGKESTVLYPPRA